MSKQEFLNNLRAKLMGLSRQDLEEHLTFYSEMIDDRMEDGLTEEEAVLDIGSVDEISEQIIADTPLTKIAKEKLKQKKQIKAWEILLLALGSPIWISLIVAALAVILSLYAALWAVIISIWATFISLVACSLGGTAAGCVFASNGSVSIGIAMIGAGIACAGLAIFLFFGCRTATAGTLLLTKKIVLEIKKCLAKKEAK